MIIVPNKAIVSALIIELYSKNITLEIETLPEFHCDTSPLKQFECRDKSKIGTDCNITNDICTMSKPCLNGGTCHLNQSYPLNYSCQCLSDEYSGSRCEYDNRVCKDNTCW